jgi:hypothetical protein
VAAGERVRGSVWPLDLVVVRMLPEGPPPGTSVESQRVIEALPANGPSRLLVCELDRRTATRR